MTATDAEATTPAAPGADLDHEVIVIGAGVAGIYQIKRLTDLGVDAIVVETGDDLGGTWYWNRYPGARFDSESYSYGYSFSPELLEEWHWTEMFSPQPENLRYLNYVADKFDLRRHMRFGCRVEAMTWNDDGSFWTVRLVGGEELTTRYVLTGIGLLSIPTPPRYEGMDDFTGTSFHTFHWPHEPIDLAGKRVAVIGTGATAIQLIPAIAPEVGHLSVLQRRPNWAAPLNNREISDQEMADIRSRYDEIFERCARTPGGFDHEPDRRGWDNFSRAEREAIWQELYELPGFAIWLSNFVETFIDEEANAELSAWMADKIRSRVDDPEVAEKLIPTDHGFGIQRVPMETGYFETYNLPHVELVDIGEHAIERITPEGILTADGVERPFDVIVYATGFNALTGAYDEMDIRGVGGERLFEKWKDGPSTFLGILINGFPNLIMLSGPQSGSASTNFPRGIETCVNWATDLLEHVWAQGHTRIEATAEAEAEWTQHVIDMYAMVLLRKAQSWFTGYNSNVDGHEKGTVRYPVYNGGAPKFVRRINEVAADGYTGLEFR
ncbi:MAG: NAD(P)/FAD-dependent oxidoreductase [Actinomycetota bacterium]